MDGGEGERRPRHPCGSKSPATVIATSAHHGGYVVGRRRLRRVISAPSCLILDPRDRPRRPIVFACPRHETQVLGVHYITNTSRKSTAQPPVGYRVFTRDARHHANPNHINTPNSFQIFFSPLRRRRSSYRQSLPSYGEKY